MTKTVTGGMAVHIAQPTTTLAWCWKIIRTDGVEFFYTGHDKRLTIAGDDYTPVQGFTTTAVENISGMGVSKSEATAILTADGLKPDEVRAGLFDYAEIRVFLVNWANIAHGDIKMRRGWFGEVSLTPEGIFKTEVRSMAQALSTRIIEISTPECRVDLFSPRCKLVADDYRVSGTVAEVSDRRTFSFTSGDALFEHGYTGGEVMWTSGDNVGRPQEIYSNYQDEIGLFLPPGYPISPGDTFTMTPGCGKRRGEDCRDKYDNVINFQGEPDMPGNDAFFLYPDVPEG
jgi:uncharacterized phage protein (TIGR02218 family)